MKIVESCSMFRVFDWKYSPECTHFCLFCTFHWFDGQDFISIFDLSYIHYEKWCALLFWTSKDVQFCREHYNVVYFYKVQYKFYDIHFIMKYITIENFLWSIVHFRFYDVQCSFIMKNNAIINFIMYSIITDTMVSNILEFNDVHYHIGV